MLKMPDSWKGDKGGLEEWKKLCSQIFNENSQDVLDATGIDWLKEEYIHYFTSAASCLEKTSGQMRSLDCTGCHARA